MGDRDRRVMVIGLVTMIVALAWLFMNLFFSSSADAQEVVEVPEVPHYQLVAPESLRRGQPAPRDGLFVEPMTYVGLTMTIDALEGRLDETVSHAREVCDREVRIERFRTESAASILTLHQRLWEQRQTELLDRIQEANEAAQRQWWEEPVLWLALGGALVGAVVGIVAAAVSN